MFKPLSLILMAIQSFCLLAVSCAVLITAGQEEPFWHLVCYCLPLLAGSGGALVWLKLHGQAGHSRLVAASSVVFILGGPVVFAAAWTLGWDQPEAFKLSFCALLAYAVGCLFYWVSCQDDDFYRPI